LREIHYIDGRGKGGGRPYNHKCIGEFMATSLKGDTVHELIDTLQRLDTKTLQRLETAVSKSEYSQGKKLKVIPKVRLKPAQLYPVLNGTTRSTLISKAAWSSRLGTERLI